MRKLTTEEWIAKAIAVHGDKYDYSKTTYINSRTELKIICKLHGVFFQLPSVHTKGNGCPKCSGKEQHTTESFIALAKVIHNDKYIYTNSVYTLGKNKIKIICPIHGEFKQVASDHLCGHGCKSCSSEIIRNSKIKSKDNFIATANAIHNNKYRYRYLIYTTRKDKVIITCPIHGNFEQIPKSHLAGQGCPHCSLIEKSNKLSSDKEEFINKALEIHGSKYNYDKSVYIHSKQKMTIVCPIHGNFEQIPNTHLMGSGCPNCANNGFDRGKPGYLYYLKVTTNEGKELYKIGITNRTVNERFSLTDLQKIEIVKQKLYESGADAYNWEQYLLKKYKQYQYQGPKVLESGNTELFTEDVLSIYYAQIN